LGGLGFPGPGPRVAGVAAPTFNWQNTQSNSFLANSTSINIGSTNARGSNGTFTSGDVLIAVLALSALSETITPPSGWTQGGTVQDSHNSFTYAWFWHVCNGSETGSFAFSWGTSTGAAWTLLDYQGVNNSTPIDTSAINAWTSNSGTSVTTASITPTSANDGLVLLVLEDEGNAITVPGDMTSRFNVLQASSTITSTASDRTAGSTSSQTETFTASATFKGGAYALIALTP
jgi:hypothetical protein